MPMESVTQQVPGRSTGMMPGVQHPLKDNTYRSDIELGKEYRESQTGYQGFAIAIYFYQNSCERVELERYDKKRGLQSYAFDAKRLVEVESGKKVDSPQPGGPDRGNTALPRPSR